MEAKVTAPKEYPKAPIKEAVIDFRAGRVADASELERIVKALKDRYPITEPVSNIDFRIDATGSSAVQVQQTGFRLSSNDRADVAIVQGQGLTTARLAPYIGWDAFRTIAVSNWKKYGSGKLVNRIGVRYINRIDIPLLEGYPINLEEYILVSPKIPSISDRPMTEYNLRVVMQLDDTPWTCAITSALVRPSPLLSHVSILLDIDIFRISGIPKDEQGLWGIVDEARVLKNKVFESSITDKARGLFEL